MSLLDRIRSEFRAGSSALRQIIIINLAVFVLVLFFKIGAVLMNVDRAALEHVLSFFYLPSNPGTLLIRPWTLITNIFMHADLRHILLNMFVLYMLGRVLEQFISNNKFWTIFMGGALAGAVLFVLSYNVFPVFADIREKAVLLGASGGVTAIAVATGVLVPNYEVRLFGVFRITMKWVAAMLVLLDLAALPGLSNAGGVIAHLGGAIFGALFILRGGEGLKLPRFKVKLRSKSRMKVVHYDEREIHRNRVKKRSKPNQDEIDAILDKINHSGYDSLTRDEKETLIKASE